MVEKVKIDTAKKWGGSTVIPLTGYIEQGKRYIIQKSIIKIGGKDRNCVIIVEDKTSIPNVHIIAKNDIEILPEDIETINKEIVSKDIDKFTKIETINKDIVSKDIDKLIK